MPVTEVPFFPNPACPLTDFSLQVRELWDAGEHARALDTLESAILHARPAPDGLTDADLIECLKLLADDHKPLCVVGMFYGLAHRSEKVPC